MMKITPKNISELSIGQDVWIPHSFKIQDKYKFLGIQEDNFGEYYTFGNTSGGGFSIFKKYVEGNEKLEHGVYTTYEECCVRMRELCLLTIDHFNKHQLKNDPILVQSKVLEIQ